MTKTHTRRLKKPTQQPKWHRVATCYVAGLMHWDYDATKIKRGTKIKLYHERSNPVNSAAISVWAVCEDKMRKLGYIPENAKVADGHNEYNLISYLHGLKARNFSFYCLVNQHDLGNDTGVRMTIQIKVCRTDGANPFTFSLAAVDDEL